MNFMPVQSGAVLNYKNSGTSTLEGTLARAENLQENKDDLKDVCYDFEALLIKQMLDSMRKTVQKTDLFGDEGMSREIFEDMLYDEYAKQMARTAKFGIAENLYKQFSSSGINITV